MTVTKTMGKNSLASATSVVMKQQAQSNAPIAREEKILVMGNYQKGKTSVTDNKIELITNANDAGSKYGFGSPLHRMIKK